MRNSSGTFLRIFGVALFLAFTPVVSTFASSTDFNQTSPGTYNSGSSTFWDNGVPTNNGLDDNFTMSFSGAITVTNFISAGGGSLNYVRLSTTGSGSLTVISSGFFSDFGLQLNTGDTLILSGNTTISNGNNSFADQGGTLVVSNGATAVINIGANAVQNTGTIQLTATNSQTSQINYGQSTGGAFNNSGTGTIVKNGTGTGQLEGQFGGNNIGFINNGTMIVNGGTLLVDPNNAFSGPFVNNATITVNNSANFVIARTAGAWGGGTAPTNSGTVFLNGGTITANVDSGGQGVTNQIANAGSIIGNGTVAISVAQGNSGSTVASNGVLNVFGTYNGGQATFTSSGGAFGTMKAVSGGDLKIIGNVASGNAASWVVNAGGTVEVAGVNADLGASFMPGSQLNGEVRVSSGGNLTISGATGINGQTLQQNGTFEFSPTSNVGAVSIFMPNVAGLNAFTNAGTFVLTGTASGIGTFETGFGAGNNNYGFVNTGTILAAGGGTLIINTSDANSMGFSNTASGTIVITNGSLLRLDRSAGAWTNVGSAPAVNMGLMILSNATFQTATAGTLDQSRVFQNEGTILVQGQLNSTNSWQASLLNAGTIVMTNNNASLLIGTSSTANPLTNTATGTIILGTNGTVASLVATNIGNLSNFGTVQGQGTITLGRNNATGGQNANFVNSGNLIATNWGGAGGTLFISVGNAFSNGGFSNTAAGTIQIASNMTLTVNRSENAWANSGNSVANAGTISMGGGSLDLAADGVVSNAASFINTGLISGYGTINSVVITTNGGKLLAIATNLTSVGTLTASIASTTNNSTATLGVVGTNSVLNLLAPNSQNVLINFGTISLSGGSIDFNGGTGTITNFNIIAGVGNASSFPIVNAGTLASFIAQGPISGLSNLIANVGVTNTGLLGANNLIGGAATLTLDTATGGGLVNNGTVALQGGFITVTNAAGADAGITNQNGGLIYGVGTQNVGVANLGGGTLLASNGILRLGMSTANAGVVSNFNSASTVILTNTILQNTGTIALNGGGLIMGGSTITNDGTIIGPGNYSSGLYNNPDGTVIAQNGTLAIATNGATESVNNLGTFSIASGSTLSVTPDWNNTNGLVSLSGGTLTGGAVTNKGTVTGNGTIASSAFVNAATGTVTVSSGGTLNVLSTSVAMNGTMVAGTSESIVITNSTSLVNNGTLILNGAVSDANTSFLLLRNGGAGDFTNAAGAVIEGAGYLATGISEGTSFTEWNLGSILATNGSLILQPLHAFASGGFVNLAGGTVTVASNSTLGIERNNDAWSTSGTVPINAGVIQINGGSVTFYGDSLAIANDRAWSNTTSGVISGFGTLTSSLNDLGTVVATNGNLNINNASAIVQNGAIDIAANGTLTVLGSAGSFQNNGQMALSGGAFVGTNFSELANAGTISGFGTIQTGRLSGTGGANQQIINMTGGLIDATNGTLFLSPGDAFSNGGFSNAAGATVRVENNSTLTLNRTANAWNSSGLNPRNMGTLSMAGGTFALDTAGTNDLSRFVDNYGTISGQGAILGSVTNYVGATIRATGGTLALQGTGAFSQQGTLEVDSGATMSISNVNGLASLSNAGTINMNGGTLLAGAITNANWIFGNGSITGNVASGVINLSNSFLFASNGVLSASLGSYTNGVGVTMGTLSTNATLNVQMPGGVTQPLINLGTLSFEGGTLLANGSSSGTITNGAGGIIVGVGNVTQTVANNGTILAADPVSGLNIFSVGLSSVNSATIGASNGAILNVVLSGGGGSSFNNNGSISMLGGTLIISNGTPGLITNNFFVSGSGTITPNILNNGTVEATVNGGVLDVSLLGGTNIATGYLGAGSGATLQFENSSLVNQGTIGPVGSVGGTIQMASASAIISNQGTIQGINGLAFNSFVQNNNYLYATNGVVSFNAVNGLGNAGTINIGNGGTLQSNSSNSWSNAGTINLLGGTLRTGGFTNVASSAVFTNNSLIIGYGTIIGGGADGQTGAGFDKSFANLGTILATNPISGTPQTLYISTGGATTGNGIQNLGTMIVSSNDTLALDRGGLPILNTGTITINNGTLASTSTITNTLGGIIQGYGTLTASIVNQSGGTIRATNGLLSMTSTVFPINQGTFEIDNGSTLTWDATNSWQNNGTVSLLGGTLRTGGPTNISAGGEPFTNLNYMVGFGTIIGGGAFNTNGPGFDKAILNLGTIVANGGTLVIDTGVSTLSNGIDNAGTMIVSNATDTLVLRREAETGVVTNNNFIINTGTILINGGTLTANTAITNQFLSGSLPGLIQGFGTIALTNQLVNLGTIRSTNTSMSGSGVLQFINPSGSALQINQSGTLVVEGASQMLFGSDTNAPLLNSGIIVMNGGTLSSGMLTNSHGATFRGFGTITSSIINSGTGLATSLSAPLYLTGNTIFNQTNGVLGANNGRLVVNTVFTNAGTVSFANSLGTFNNAVVNQGAWISDPSTNVFLGTYTVATNGYINMASGDVYMFQSNFVNVSSQSNQYNTLNGKFVMDGQGTQQFYVAGLNLGGFASSAQTSNETFFTTGAGTFSTNSFAFNKNDSVFGFSNNFALGTMELSGLSTTVLMDSFGTVGSNDGDVAGLYLNTLTLDPGSLLIISNNVELYFESTNGVTGIGYGTLGAGDNVLLLDGSSFHQLTVVPEPSILMLFSVGAVGIVSYRRRKAKLSAKR